jgi:hypothetical protein
MSADPRIMRRHRRLMEEYAGMAARGGFQARFALVRRLHNLRAAAGDASWQERPRDAIRLPMTEGRAE